MNSSLALVCAINDERVLNGNLLKSPMLATGKVPLYVEKGHACAGAAYNAGLRRAAAEYIVFAHQDVYFPAGWDERLLAAIHRLDQVKRAWAVLGIWGVEANGQFAGRLWCNANSKELEGNVDGMREVISFDEVVLVLKSSVGLRFDEQLPSFHLYGTDIVLEAKKRGFPCFVFEGPVIHNSLVVGQLNASYRAAYRYIRHKWNSCLPIANCVVPITGSGWPLFRRWLHVAKLQLLRRDPIYHPRHPDPRKLAAELGYEQRVAI